MSYFDNLEIDYTVEIANGESNEYVDKIETLRRLMYMFKLAVNGSAVMLTDIDGNVVAISPEFTTVFGWTLEEFQSIYPDDFFHEDSLAIATIHEDNSLSAPYIARCKNKAEQSAYFKIQGLCIAFDSQQWRMTSFVQI